MTIKVILFDFDGVLTMNKTGKEALCASIARQSGLKYSNVYECYIKYHNEYKIGNISKDHIWSGICACLGKKLSIDVFDNAVGDLELNKPIFNFIKNKLLHKYIIGILTDATLHKLSIVRRKFNLDDIFTYYISAQEARAGKRSRNLYEYALTKIKAKPNEVLYIDNSRHHVAMAKDLGFVSIFYDSNTNSIAYLSQKVNKAILQSNM